MDTKNAQSFPEGGCGVQVNVGYEKLVTQRGYQYQIITHKKTAQGLPGAVCGCRRLMLGYEKHVIQPYIYAAGLQHYGVSKDQLQHMYLLFYPM